MVFKSKSIAYFSIVGLSGLMIQMGISWLMISCLKYQSTISVAIAILLVNIYTYILNNFFTFQENIYRSSLFINLKRYFKYFIVSAFGMFLNLILFGYFYSLTRKQLFLSQCLSVLIVFVLNYKLSSSFVWYSKEKKD